MPKTSLSWDEACAVFEQQRQAKKVMRFAVPGGDLCFTIRMVTQQEKDHVEAKFLAWTGRNRGGVVGGEDVTKLKVEQIKIGVVEGPPGFLPTNENILKLPHYIRDGLADQIWTFNGLDDETADAFRPEGPG